MRITKRSIYEGYDGDWASDNIPDSDLRYFDSPNTYEKDNELEKLMLENDIVGILPFRIVNMENTWRLDCYADNGYYSVYIRGNFSPQEIVDQVTYIEKEIGMSVRFVMNTTKRDIMENYNTWATDNISTSDIETFWELDYDSDHELWDALFICGYNIIPFVVNNYPNTWCLDFYGNLDKHSVYLRGDLDIGRILALIPSIEETIGMKARFEK